MLKFSCKQYFLVTCVVFPVAVVVVGLMAVISLASADSSSSLPPSTPTEITTRIPPTTMIPECEDLRPCLNAGDLLPYPEDCRKYIKCDANLSYIIETCPMDFEFSPSPEFMRCVPVYFAECKPCLA